MSRLDELMSKYGEAPQQAAPVPPSGRLDQLMQKYGDEAAQNAKAAQNEARWGAMGHIEAPPENPEPSPTFTGAPPRDRTKLSLGEQAGVGAVAFTTAALDRMLKMGSAANKVVTAGVNTLIADRTLGKDGLNKLLGLGFDSFQPGYSANEVSEITTKPVNDAIAKYTNNDKKLSSFLGLNARNVSSFAGDIAPSVPMPQAKLTQGANWLGRVINTAATGAYQGAIYGGSEQAEGDVGDIAKGGTFGGIVGGLFGGAGQSIAEAGRGILRHVGNKVVTYNTEKGKLATNDLLNEIGVKSKTVAEDTHNIALDVYRGNQKSKDVLNDLYTSAYKKEISYKDAKAILSNPLLKETIAKYRNKLMASSDPKNTTATRYQQLNTPIRNNIENSQYNPNGLESWDSIARAMNDDISLLYANKQIDKAANLKNLRNDLLNRLDDVSPEYRAARELAEEGKVLSELFDEVGLNQVAKGNTQAYKKVANMIMDTKSPPESIKIVRDAIAKRDPEVWKSIVRETFENQVNNAKTLQDATPLDFIKGVMTSKNRANLVYEALNFPGNEKTLAKLEILGLIYKDVTKPSTADNILSPGMSNVPALRNIKGNDANEINKRAIDFLFTTKYNSEFDDIIKISQQKGLGTKETANQVVKILLGPKQPSIGSDLIDRAITLKPAEIAGSKATSNEDKR